MRHWHIILIIAIGLIYIRCGTDKKNKVDQPVVVPQENKEEAIIFNEDKTAPCLGQLIEACKKNNKEQAFKLIAEGCDVNGTSSIKKNYLVSPLWYAAANQDSSILIKLLENGADPNLDLGDNYSPLTYAACHNSESVRTLIDNGAKANYFNENAVIQSPILGAIRSNGLESLKLLVENGAMISFKDINSENRIQDPIHKAIQYNRSDILDYLLQNGADPNVKLSEEYADCVSCPEGIAPIHVAAYQRDADLAIAFIDLLDAAGADLDTKSGFGQDALSYIAPSGNARVAEHLILKGLPISDSTVVRAAMYQNEDFLSVLMKYGANPNAKAYNGSAIQHALNCCGDGFNESPLSDRIKTLEILIDNGGIADESTLELIRTADK